MNWIIRIVKYQTDPYIKKIIIPTIIPEAEILPTHNAIIVGQTYGYLTFLEKT